MNGWVRLSVGGGWCTGEPCPAPRAPTRDAPTGGWRKGVLVPALPHRGYRVSPVRRVSERPTMDTGCPRYDDKGVVDWPSPQPSPTRRVRMWGSALFPCQPRLGPCRGVSCGRPWRGDRGVERGCVEPVRSRRGPRSESGKTSAGVGAGSGCGMTVVKWPVRLSVGTWLVYGGALPHPSTGAHKRRPYGRPECGCIRAVPCPTVGTGCPR